MAHHAVLLSLLLVGCGASVTGSGADASTPPRDAPLDAIPLSPDATTSTRRWPTARMVWQAPGGFAGWGLAVMITGDGIARGWINQPAFDPLGAPPPNDTRVSLRGAQIDDLFDRWSRVPLDALPHGPSSAGDCHPSVTVQPCATCMPVRIEYRHPAQVTPEMDAVWAWFRENLPASDLSTWCAF
jgi:hypothetical protein